MPLEAVLITLLAAVLHAVWNAVIKRTGDPDVMFLSMALVGTAMMLPWIAGAWGQITPAALGFAALSGLLETAYIVALATAYRRYDFSLVYPIARGSAPVFLAVLAAAWLGERPSAGALVGIGAVALGIYLVPPGSARDPLRPLRQRSLWLPLLVGLCIAGYSAVDKAGVGQMPPGGYVGLVYFFTAVWLMPVLLPGRGFGGIARTLRDDWRPALLVGVFSSVTYGLVVFAFSLAPATYVGALREVSIVFAALLGWWRLREPLGPVRLAGVLLVTVGGALIARG